MMANGASKPTLLQLAADRFGNISSGEKKLIAAVESDEDADYASLSEKDHTVRGQVFSWLCTNAAASTWMTYRGISIVEAEIDGEVDLAWMKIFFPIRAIRCVFKDTINLEYTRFFFLDLSGSTTKRVAAYRTVCETDVFLRNGFKAETTVSFRGAMIGGDLTCDGGEFVSDGDTLALDVDSASVKGSVFLRNGFKATGGVALRNATIGGNLACDGGEFLSSAYTPALDASVASIKGAVLLGKGFKAQGGVSLNGAVIGGNLAGC